MGVGSAPEGLSVAAVNPFQTTPLGYSFETFKYKTAWSIPVSYKRLPFSSHISLEI